MFVKPKARRSLLTLAICLLSTQSNAAAINSAKLPELLPYLVRTDPRILAAKQNLLTAYEGIPEARAAWLPALDLTTSYGSQQRYMPNPANNTSYGDNEQRLILKQLIYDFGKTGASIDRAHEIFRKGVVTFDGTVQDVLLDGVTAYLNVYAAKHTLLYAQSYTKNVMSQVQMEEERKKRGSGYETDVLEAKAQLSGAQARLVRAEGRMISAKNAYYRTFRIHPTNTKAFTLPSRSKHLLPSTLSAALKISLKNNTEIRALEYDISIAQQKIRSQKANFLPTISMGVEGRRRKNVDGVPGRRLDYIEQVGMDYSLFSGFGDLASYRASKDSLAAAIKNLDNQRLIIRQNVSDDWEQLTTARLSYKKTALQTEQLSEFLHLATKERKLGRRTLLEVLVADGNYINAADASVAALVELHLARFRLIRDMNTLTLQHLSQVLTKKKSSIIKKAKYTVTTQPSADTRLKTNRR